MRSGVCHRLRNYGFAEQREISLAVFKSIHNEFRVGNGVEINSVALSILVGNGFVAFVFYSVCRQNVFEHNLGRTADSHTVNNLAFKIVERVIFAFRDYV